MNRTTQKLTYKTLFIYSLVVIALLLIAVPVFAANHSGLNLLDFGTPRKPGHSPQHSRTLSRGVNIDHLTAGQESWYVYDRQSFDQAEPAWISLALRYESEARIDAEQVNFEIFTQRPDEGWFQAAAPASEVIGAGVRSPLPATGSDRIESFWSGPVAETVYYVRVYNHSPFDLDYILEAREEGPAGLPAARDPAGGAAEPFQARRLAWTLTAQAVESMTADEAAVWMQQAQAAGWLVTGSALSQAAPRPEEADPGTLWNLTAQAIHGQEAEAAARWLIQADSLGWLSIPLTENHTFYPPAEIAEQVEEETTEPASPAPPPLPEESYTPINIYPNNPLDLNLEQVNSGRLPPYGEHWYVLSRADLDEDLIEDMKLTMFFTPRTGYISNRINFEIFPAGQYQIWARGDANYMEPMGAGMWTSRDEDPHTGERIWNGTLVDGDRYLVKVKNGAPDIIDYYLFPTDVENAELGQPTLHHSDSAAGYVPYALSPATRLAD